MSARKIGKKRIREAKPQEERRSDLLNAAAAIFSRDGVTDAKIEDITEFANVSKGTFYLYFRSKDEAAAELWRRYIDEFIRIGESILNDQAVPTGARLVGVFQTLTQFVLSNAAFHRNLYRAAEAESVKSAANQRLIDLIGAVVHHGVEIGELHCEQPELTVRMMFHGVCDSVNDLIRSKRPIQTDVLIRTAGRVAHTVFGVGKPRVLRNGPRKSSTSQPVAKVYSRSGKRSG
jgi:AcrR family transcriptional regulator